MIIQHNMCSAMANRQLNETEKKYKVSTERLSSGYRINYAADDAAGLTISEKMRWQVRGLNRASENIQDGISMTQVADGAMQEVHDILQRIRELAVQGANDTNNIEDREAIQEEIDSLRKEINRISTDTEFNRIKIFKPTTTPELTGDPTDILVYHEDYNGIVREGGIIYSGRRYAYEDMDLEYDENGNIKEGTYEVEVYAEDGTTKIPINLIFDGGSRVPSGREYSLDPKEDGIYIDTIRHGWDEIKDERGVSLDPSNIKPGTYSFQHAGFTVSFEVEDEMDLNSLMDMLKADGLETYELRSTDVTTVTQRITPSVRITEQKVVNANDQMYIPGNTATNSSSYRMYADEDGIYMYIDAAQSMTGQKIILTKMTWEELGLNEWTRYNPDPDYNWVNPDSSVTGGERATVYTYKDSFTGITIDFTVDSEVSKGELINAINAWSINVKTNNEMIVSSSTTGSVPITPDTHSQSLDAYGTQYGMGRTMSEKMVLADKQGLSYSADTLSFPMTDANGKTYLFSASGARSSIEDSVRSYLSFYIRSYANNYENRLNYGSAGTVSSSFTGSLRFNCDNYYMDFKFPENFSGWLSDSMFTDTKDPDDGWHEVTYDETKLLNDLSGQINALTESILDSFKNMNVTINTDTGDTIASNTISSTLTTQNKRYTSTVIPGDREVKIQSGCLSYQYIAIKLPAMNSTILGIGSIDVSSYDAASESIAKCDTAINRASNMRSGYGATQNRLESAMAVDDNIAENSQAAESRIRDADMSVESVAQARNRVLMQAGQNVLSQANHINDNLINVLLR